MVVDHSPKKDYVNEQKRSEEVTLVTVLQAIKSMDAKINERLQHVEEKTNLIYDRVRELESKGLHMQDELEDVKSSIKDCRDDIKEQTDRIKRRDNLIVMGIPENTEGEEMLTELITLILPDYYMMVMHDRVGPKKENANHPRPIRLFLQNPKMKSTALKNCKLLKNHIRLQKVSVRKDLTKIEQLEKKNSPRVTRSASQRANKRPRISPAVGGETSSSSLTNYRPVEILESME